MKLVVSDVFADFLDDQGRLAGRYIYRAPFKPYLHPLKTPDGHTLTLAMPHDHKHQRGVMYALEAHDVNFWEERVVRSGEAVGLQQHVGLTTPVTLGASVSLMHELLWTTEEGALDTFHEKRRIVCALDGASFAWQWEARLTALRNVKLVTSQWAHRIADGTEVNYHGLGFRLRRDFGGPLFSGTTIFCDGAETPPADAMGMVPGEVTYLGSIDGYEAAPRAGVTVRQGGRHTLFLTTYPYPLICLGPTNRGPLRLDAGQELKEDFSFWVFDGMPAPASRPVH